MRRPYGDRSLEELHQLEQDLWHFKVLDPACGSGNFLYMAYRELRRIEKVLRDKLVVRSRRPGVEAEIPMGFVSATQFHGIDVRPFAIEVPK